MKFAQIRRMKLIKLWPLVVAALISGGVTFAVAASGTAAGVGPTIAGEPEATLAMHGLRLVLAESPATVAKSRAIEVARGTIGSSEFAAAPAVRQVLLVRVVRSAPPLDALCWIVSFDPSGFRHVGGPAPKRSGDVTPRIVPQVNFYTVYVDATTGAWLFSEAGN
jgi:hypothetical protein